MTESPGCYVAMVVLFGFTVVVPVIPLVLLGVHLFVLVKLWRADCFGASGKLWLAVFVGVSLALLLGPVHGSIAHNWYTGASLPISGESARWTRFWSGEALFSLVGSVGGALILRVRGRSVRDQ